MKLSAPKIVSNSPVKVPTSKSIANRLLIIQALSKSGKIKDISTADDTVILQKLLKELPSVMNVGHAGTAFRFLTAFLAITKGSFVLTGSDRMKNRPIAPLVNALRELGADIEYLETEGFPPLQIKGKDLKGGSVSVNSSMSSQFVSALMMIGPYLKNGLEINLTGKLVSRSYIVMTESSMQKCGAKVTFENAKISIEKGVYQFETVSVEKDWSAISFWYALVLIGKLKYLLIQDVSKSSIQGDAYVQELFEPFGVQSKFDTSGLHLSYIEPRLPLPKSVSLNSTPDLTQPFVVAMAEIGHEITVEGIGHLKHKETDRAEALKIELAKFGAVLDVQDDIVILKKGILHQPISAIKTYQDHRMAMAFSLLSLRFNGIVIENPEVVEKSYPDFWEQMKVLGIRSI